MADENDLIKAALGDFNETLDSMAREIIDGLINGGFIGLKKALRMELSVLYFNARTMAESLQKQKSK